MQQSKNVFAKFLELRKGLLPPVGDICRFTIYDIIGCESNGVGHYHSPGVAAISLEDMIFYQNKLVEDDPKE